MLTSSAPMPTRTTRPDLARDVMPVLRAAAAPEHSSRTSYSPVEWCGGELGVESELGGHGDPEGVHVGDGHRRGAEGSCDLSGEQTDRAGAGDQHPVTGLDGGSSTGPDADRDGLGHGGVIVVEARRDLVGKSRRQRHVLADRTVDGWGREEHDVGAQVVAPGQAGRAVSARDTGLQRDVLPDAVAADALTDRAMTPAASWPMTIGASTTYGPMRPCSK